MMPTSEILQRLRAAVQRKRLVDTVTNLVAMPSPTGEAVRMPEPFWDCLPVVGRGSATWKVSIRRPGPPVHEVMRPVHEPSVIAAGADLVCRLQALSAELRHRSDRAAGCESVFIGQVHSGDIFNQYAQECWLEGTRRWL